MADSTDPELFTTQEVRQLPKRKPRLKRVKITFTIPGEAASVVHAERRKRKMSMSELLNSLLAYQCWSEKEHALTGDAVKSRDGEQLLWEEINRDYGKPNKTGSYFAHRVARAVAKLIDPETEA